VSEELTKKWRADAVEAGMFERNARHQANRLERRAMRDGNANASGSRDQLAASGHRSVNDLEFRLVLIVVSRGDGSTALASRGEGRKKLRLRQQYQKHAE
jgi:hypothetical protein